MDVKSAGKSSPSLSRRRHSPSPSSTVGRDGTSASASTSNNCPELHLAALASLKGEIYELSNRLKHLSEDRELLEKQLTKAQLDRIQLSKNNDDRLDQQAQRYEERITELHSVIAELSKKLNHQQATIIPEEDESHQSESESRHSHFTSNDNNANESCSERDTEDANPELCQLVVDLHSSVQKTRRGNECEAVGVMNASQNTITELSQAVNRDISTQQNHQNWDANEQALLCSGNNYKTASTQSLEMYQIHDDMLILQAENKQLREMIGCRDEDICQARLSIATLRDDRDRLRRKIQELQSRLHILQNSQGSHDSGGHTMNSCASPARSKSPHVNSTTGENTPTCREDPVLISKMAERVKLKKMECGDKHVLGSEISSVGISSTKIAEHLVQHVQEESNAQEILQALCSSGSNISECKVKEFEVEMERLNSKIDHLKSQNDLLNLTLDESRTQCDRLSVLIGKYESNCTALQLSHNYSDQCLDTYHILVMLLDGELGLLLANCRAAGLGSVAKKNGASSGGEDDDDEVAALLKRAHENRKSAENLARHLLHRLDRSCNSTTIFSMPSTPWDDLSSHNTSSSSTCSGDSAELSKGDEQRLREYIDRLKNDRAAVQVTVAELESVHIDPLAHHHSLSMLDSQKLDLENAVLMQELMAIKEEKAELKAQVYLLEKEKSALELRLNTREAQEQAYRVHIEHLKAELQDKELAIKRLAQYIPTSTKGCDSSNGDQADVATILGELPKDLVEAARREKKLKSRIQEVVSTLEKVSRNSELRHQQSADFVHDLKRANTAIIAAFERSKKKHQTKLKKIEQQMLVMMDRHNSQVRLLRQKLDMQEEERNAQSNKPGETAL